MNQQDRRAYSQHSIRQQARIEGRHIKPIYKALRITVDNFLADAKANGISKATSNLYLVIDNPELTKELQALHEDAGLFFGRKAYREIKASAKSGRKDWNMQLNADGVYVSPAMEQKAGFGFNLQWAQDILDWFLQDMFSMVSRITNTTRNYLLEVLGKAQQNGASFEDIENELHSKGVLTTFAWRARLIARTETAKAAFAGRQLANRDSEWETEKEWIAANDHRTRHGHRMVDGEVIDADARFQVQYPKGVDMMVGPGDPTANVANLANCRCSQAVRAKRDANGRLIRKQPALTASLT